MSGLSKFPEHGWGKRSFAIQSPHYHVVLMWPCGKAFRLLFVCGFSGDGEGGGGWSVEVGREVTLGAPWEKAGSWPLTSGWSYWELRRGAEVGWDVILAREDIFDFSLGMRSMGLLEGASKVMSFPINLGQWETPLTCHFNSDQDLSPSSNSLYIVTAYLWKLKIIFSQVIDRSLI